MSNSRAVGHLYQELDALFERFSLEYDITFVEMIGALECFKLNLAAELMEGPSEEEEEEEEEELEEEDENESWRDT